ncbi:alpha/beta fold hydrolase [Vibrio sinaloensis]|uniref:alpha/beta fold hydrolase n=1 Tax=Photobacterium sp. (strain ATCC 43367) TaxID=379097 RepID=UPI0020488BB8|nr:alpha/beta hydrolase [Vibrio sinaloensis]UPQ89154.1 lysophospholipase [Vibrio sinaloensis]
MFAKIVATRLQAFVFTLLLVHSVTFTNNAFATQLNDSESRFFSLKEVQLSRSKELAPLGFISSSDGVPLAFRNYHSVNPKAILIFYHGAGAHSGLLYNHLGVGLRDEFQMTVYMPDIRGHGSSGGARGDAPSENQVWHDITMMIDYIRTFHPTTPIFLGGHSAGAGLILNYSNWEQRHTVAGYVLVAPYLGFRSKTSLEPDDEDYRFSEVNVAKFVVNSITKGLFFSHSKAVEFNFPKDILEKNPEIVTFNTVTMSNAITPSSPSLQLHQLKRFGLWIGSKDEAFDSEKVMEFAENNRQKHADAEINVLDGETHFSIILRSADVIGSWILHKVQ